MSAASPKLSILLICYNQEKFIEKALESILAQRMPKIPIEIVVADDCSDDNSLEIIESRLSDASWSVRILPSEQRLGITRNYQRGFRECRGDYVAIIEGDDYWTCPTKLQEQFLFLENHTECPAVCTNHFIYEENRKSFNLKFSKREGYEYIDAYRLIQKNEPGNFSTLLYRRSALLRLPPALFEGKSYDWIINICIAREGPIGLLYKPMSVYRIHSEGTWNRLNHAEKIQEEIENISKYDLLTGGVFHDAFQESIRRRRQLLWLRGRHVKDFIPLFLYYFYKFFIPPILSVIFFKAINRIYSFQSKG